MIENAVDYLEGLQKLADNLEKIIAGSTLNNHELSTLAYIQGYLSTAKWQADNLRRTGNLILKTTEAIKEDYDHRESI